MQLTTVHYAASVQWGTSYLYFVTKHMAVPNNFSMGITQLQSMAWIPLFHSLTSLLLVPRAGFSTVSIPKIPIPWKDILLVSGFGYQLVGYGYQFFVMHWHITWHVRGGVGTLRKKWHIIKSCTRNSQTGTRNPKPETRTMSFVGAGI